MHTSYYPCNYSKDINAFFASRQAAAKTLTLFLESNMDCQELAVINSSKQTYIFFAQAIISFLTLIVAFAIGRKQNLINSRLVDLNFQISPEVTQDIHNINIKNNGKGNIYLNGVTWYENGITLMEENPYLITPSSSYHVPTDIIKNAIEKLPNNEKYSFSFDLYITDEHKSKFTVKNIINIEKQDFSTIIKCQTNDIRRIKKWENEKITKCFWPVAWRRPKL
ncbi:MAG: hypothetical protein J0M25_13000 [Flavobacteriales bacterium]|nr:hypothetical protein [Flavobacteriales bacterium]